MLFDSFASTGYKYGVISYPDSCDSLLREAMDTLVDENHNNKNNTFGYQSSIKTKNDCIVDFQDVDGLTFHDLKDYPSLLYKKKYIFFIMYDSISTQKPSNVQYLVGESSNERCAPQEETIIRFLYPIDITELNDNMTIDDFLKEFFEDKIRKLNPTNIRRAAGFLEKYYYGNMTDVYSGLHYTRVKYKEE